MAKTKKHRKSIFARARFYGFWAIIFTLTLAALIGFRFFMPGMGSAPGGFAGGEMPSMPEGFGGGEMPSMPEGFGGGEMPSMPEGFGRLLPVLAAVRGAFLPMALLLVTLDIFCIIMFIVLRRREKMADAEAENSGDAFEEEEPRRKKKSFFPYLVLLVAALVLTIKQLPGQQSESAEDIQVNEGLVSADAEYKTLTETFIGGGPLGETASELYTLAGEIELTGFEVADGDFVEEGQLIARVDRDSVEIAIAELTELLAEVDTAIEQSRADSISNSILAPTRGRIKAVYVSRGESIQDVMAEHGALMRLSLDGLMAVDIETELEPGTALRVRLSDGTELEGRVYYRGEGKCTVTLSDELAPYGDSVEIFTTDGSIVGQGELYIHSEIRITGFTGTVYQVYVSEGMVTEYEQTLLTLTDTGYTGERDRLIQRRTELEEELSELFWVLEHGGITAPCSGRVSYLNEDALSEDKDTGTKLSFREGSVGFFSFNRDEKPEDETEKKLGEIVAQDREKLEVEILLTDGSTVRVPVEYMSGSFSLGDIVRLSYTRGELSGIELFRAGSGTEGDGMSGGMGSGSGSGGMSGGSGSGAVGSGASGSFSASYGGAPESMGTSEAYSIGETIICVITPYERISVEFSVSELDVTRLSVGQSARISLDAVPGESFEARLSAIDPTGENEGGASFYTVYADIERSEQMLSGMNAAIYIELAEHEGLCIPLAALQESEEGTGVYTAYDSETDSLSGLRYIETGFSDGEYVIVSAGLSEGEKVYYRYADSISYAFSR